MKKEVDKIELADLLTCFQVSVQPHLQINKSPPKKMKQTKKATSCLCNFVYSATIF